MDVHLKLSVELGAPHSPEACLVQFRGDIFDSESGELVGNANAFVLHAELCDRHGLSPLDALDTFEATAPYMTLLSLKEAGNFAPYVLKVLGDDFAYSLNTLIIDRIEILPQYRGGSRGLCAMRVLLAQLGTACRIAAIKPYPLQFEPKESWTPEMNLDAFKLKKKDATEKLKSLYRALGFESVGRHGLMILDLADGYKVADERGFE